MPKFEWSSASTKIGVVSGIIGIIISSATAFKIFVPKNKDKAEEKFALLQESDLAPRLGVSYVSMEQSIYYSQDSGKGDSKKLLFLNYPMLSNEIAASDGTIADNVFYEDGQPVVTYLVMQNQGKATPMGDVKVVFKRYSVSHIVNVEEVPGVAADSYLAAVSAAATDSSDRSFVLPFQLDNGKGVLIPLFVISHPDNAGSPGKRSWNIVSKVLYIPQFVIYTDPFDEKEKKEKIRTMRDPVRIANGVEGKG